MFMTNLLPIMKRSLLTVEGSYAPAAAPVVYSGIPYAHAYAGYPYGAVAYAGLPTLQTCLQAEEV